MKEKLYIILAAVMLLLLLRPPAFASPFQTADKEVRGLVTDSTGSPIIGVSVGVKNKAGVGTATDINGRYILKVPANATLIFSMIGFVPQEVPVASREVINIKLLNSSSQLNETVVVAFGKQKKADVVGAVTTINPSELKIPSSNLTTALAGRIAGVIGYQRSGEPGQDNADFFIRGVTTFGYKKDPLILIDGIELTVTDLARLQPDDIASFSIMKDATATSLYGSRAANGVILVTTKEGKEGKAAITLRLENSVAAPTRNVQLADPITYMRLNNEAVLTRDPLGQLPYTDQKIDNTISGVNPYVFPATDWRRSLFKDYSNNQRANLNVSGGGSVARYYVAGSFNQDNGILRVDKQNNFNSNINLKNYSLRSNVNVNVTKSTELAVRLNGSFDDYTGPIDGGSSVYKNVMRTNPVYFPAYFPKDADHQYVEHIMFGNYEDGGAYLLNPYADMVKGYKNYSRSLMAAQFEIKQNLSSITEGLNFRTMANVTRNSYFDVTRAYSPFWYQPASYDKLTNTYKLQLMNEENGTEYLNYVPGQKTVSSSFYLEAALNYNRTFNEDHNLSGLFVFMVRNNLTGNGADLQASLPFRNVGLAGRGTYSYKNRYYVELNFGYNGSERFHESHRWGFFPSAGLAWSISNEAFFEEYKGTISNLRLRATYGLSGNDAIGDPNDRFMYLSNVNMNDPNRSAVFGRDNGYSRNGVSLSRYADPNISWELAKKANLGLEIGLFGKVDIQADIYSEKRSNILMTRTATPATMGLSAQPRANVGKAEAKGIDLQADYNHSFNKNLWIQARANFTYATSKFTNYEEPSYDGAPWKLHVGYPITQQWGYIAERLFVDDKEAAKSPRQNFGEYGGGDIKFHDVNGDGQITSLDMVPIGFPTTPEITYGFGFSVGYKRFDVSAFFQGLGRESFWIDARATAPFMTYYYPNEVLSGRPQNQLLKAYADSHWSEENRDLYALWPRLSTTGIGNDNNAQTSTWFMRNGAFIRLKQVEIGYTIRDWAFMRSLRIYANGTNLLTWSKFKLWDVEMAGNGLGYPVQRVFNLGVLANF
ncbi:TonB-linked outer membrane protein, SusC/RagA family [Chitinophaga terrae (ex Kim and Jung 2007)]|uniref:TonB-linked outer membrane protein, SusC/RagA family n=1 Tax=Chitinophaga terrae (ex Kim and Jung 2007) TaxID=408074 RepID=A0A1H4EMF7_9BACT|nr:TonB-dependent receptor [Chitinophaga terrae (ex Kim and Jung 2007)]GEP91716.1 SusC/RagA family TonB-linked outer membrane protein [Chitinophaga terrae (ex Kim and Jung 2007)]SEA85878.1 TonB-linked outer membrane protein, SusC/RagA family [Chitinophaga terrae (ex Kim and Jung 2007)]